MVSLRFDESPADSPSREREGVYGDQQPYLERCFANDWPVIAHIGLLNSMDRSNNWGLVLVLACARYLDDVELLDRGEQRWKELLDRQIHNSYVHFQALANEEDLHGFLVESVEGGKIPR